MFVGTRSAAFPGEISLGLVWAYHPGERLLHPRPGDYTVAFTEKQMDHLQGAETEACGNRHGRDNQLEIMDAKRDPGVW